MTESLEWQFGGWLGGVPPSAAWAILGGLAITGTALIVWFYRRTLRSLGSAARTGLTLLRIALLLALLFCLANPQRVREDKPPEVQRKLAVIVDRSDSMAAGDHRGTTRLATATRLWKQHEDEARHAFTNIAASRFATVDTPASSFEDAIKTTQPAAGETRLYSALDHALSTAPTAIVCLTDGLDTTNSQSEALVAKAQRNGVPIYFAVGTNRIHSSERLNIREIKVPSRVLHRSQFTANVLITVDTEAAKDVPIELWSGATKIAAQSLPMRAGRNTLVWPVKVDAAEPGAMPLEFRLGTDAKRQTAGCTTQVVEREKVDVLYYQGALQWGYRYLLAALQGDPSFRMESILNPALGIHLTAGGTDGNSLADLPDSAAELRRFQIVILAHAFANRLSAAQQSALVEYARGGGGVLFIAPDSQATKSFAGTLLEQMLPVAFLDQGAEDATARSVRTFQDQLIATFDSTAQDNTLDEGREQEVPPLQPFAPPPGGSRSAAAGIFRNADAANIPKFSLSADVRGVKAGAEVLAIKPALQPGQPAAPLLVRQQFGEGFSAVLATDLLWRWKMSLPSDSRAAEKFWQQLLLGLSSAPRDGLRLVKLTDSPALDSPVTMRADGGISRDHPPAIEAVSPEGKTTPLTLDSAAPGENDGWTTSFTPKRAGDWKVRAKAPDGNEASLQFTVSARARATEALDLQPDVDAMRRIAEATGGALLDDAPAFRAGDGTPAENPVKHLRPLWHSSGLLVALLGLYGVELLARRWFRLL